MTHDLAIINTFVLYIGFMMAIGVYYYRRTRNMSDYFLGNRKLGAWVTSLSAEASDMSGWMLMGVPGYAYLAGLNAGWIAIGIAIGTWAICGPTRCGGSPYPARSMRTLTKTMWLPATPK